MLDRPRFLGLFALALSCVFGERLNIFQTPRPDPGVRVRSGPEQAGRFVLPLPLPVGIIGAVVAAGVVAKDKGVQSKLEQPDGREAETRRKDVLPLVSARRAARIPGLLPHLLLSLCTHLP